MKITDNALKCPNCDPSHELTELNSPWGNHGVMGEYFKNFVGVQHFSKVPENYDEKLERKICPFCDSELIDTGITCDELHEIGKFVNYNRQILEAMISLKEKDPIEYQLKLNQFELQYEQKEAMKMQTPSTVSSSRNVSVSCPYCKSTNTTKISATSKAVSVAVWGIFSRKVHKQWHCNSCKSDF